ncbi:Neurotransmitter-gated ion-channel transmembrane region, partial [Cooperia oncophora]
LHHLPTLQLDFTDVPGYLVNKKETKKLKSFPCFITEQKTLFYTVILIIPTVLMAFLSMMAFYLPADSAEKISLTINLLALVVFLLLVSKILPPTSNIPLMGKYLLLAFVLNITTVVVTVVIVNVYFRSAISHEMPDYVRSIFLGFSASCVDDETTREDSDFQRIFRRGILRL